MSFRSYIQIVLESYGLLMGLLTMILFNIQSAQPEPYMDEIFHIPQTKRYCESEFDAWDPKITTFPGLYFVSVGILKLFTLFTKQPLQDVCNTFSLRCINCFFCASNYLIFLMCIKRVDARLENEHTYKWASRCLQAVNLTLMPLLFFYAFLFYTEQISTLFVMLTIYNFLVRNELWFTVFGALAVFARQTNVIWLLFICANVFLDDLNCRFRNLQTQFGFAHFNKRMDEDLQVLSYALFKKPLMLLNIPLRSMARCSGLILVGIAFVAFVYDNNGVVLGDKSAHFAVLNIPQIFYFVVFSCALTPTRSLVTLLQLFKNRRQYPSCMAAASVMLVLVCIHWFTFVHPYTLADNRHIVFYIWSKGFRLFRLQRYLYAPVYILCGMIMWNNLHKSLSLLWKVTYFVCTFLSVVTSPLLELRYFVIPFVLYKLFMDHDNNNSKRALIHDMVEVILNSLINFAVLYLFLHRTFEWPQNPGVVQRFMW